MEWAQVRALAADRVSQREIAARLAINRRTVARLAAAAEPPRYSRSPAGSMLDPLEPVIRRLLEEWPEIRAARVTEILREDYGYAGSVDLVKRRLARLRSAPVRAAQRTGYRPGQVLQVDWAEMPTRPRIAGRERRVYALVCALPFSGAATAHFSFDMSIESFLEGHVRALGWLGGVPRECVYDNLRSAVASREGDRVTWNPRFLQLRGHYAFHATACTPATPREKGSVEGAVRYLKKRCTFQFPLTLADAPQQRPYTEAPHTRRGHVARRSVRVGISELLTFPQRPAAASRKRRRYRSNRVHAPTAVTQVPRSNDRPRQQLAEHLDGTFARHVRHLARSLDIALRHVTWPQHCRSVKVVPQRPGSCSSTSPSWRSRSSSLGLTRPSSRFSKAVANCSGRRR